MATAPREMIVDALQRIGAATREIRDLLDDGAPDAPGSEVYGARASIGREIERIDAARASWPAGDQARAALEQAVRAHRELRWWSVHPDEDDGCSAPPELDYDQGDVWYEAMEDACELLGAREATAIFRERTELSDRVRRPRWFQRRPELEAIARELREIVEPLGPRPWERASGESLEANHRLEALAVRLRHVMFERDASDPLRPVLRRAAHALWFLEHLRISEAPAVWSELERATAALARALP